MLWHLTPPVAAGVSLDSAFFLPLFSLAFPPIYSSLFINHIHSVQKGIPHQTRSKLSFKIYRKDFSGQAQTEAVHSHHFIHEKHNHGS